MKNGRFSGKNTSKRWFTVTCGSSDSTWLKSGFTVRSTVTASLITALASTPARHALSVARTPSSPRTRPQAKPHRGWPAGCAPARRPGCRPSRKLLADAADPTRDVGPERRLVGARDDAGHRDAPRLLRGSAEAEGLERDGEQHDVAVGREAPLRPPERVVGVVVVLPFGRDAVALDPERIGEEQVRAPPVLVRVEHQAHHVVFHDGLAPREVARAPCRARPCRRTPRRRGRRRRRDRPSCPARPGRRRRARAGGIQ